MIVRPREAVYCCRLFSPTAVLASMQMLRSRSLNKRMVSSWSSKCKSFEAIANACRDEESNGFEYFVGFFIWFHNNFNQLLPFLYGSYISISVLTKRNRSVCSISFFQYFYLIFYVSPAHRH